MIGLLKSASVRRICAAMLFGSGRTIDARQREAQNALSALIAGTAAQGTEQDALLSVPFCSRACTHLRELERLSCLEEMVGPTRRF